MFWRHLKSVLILPGTALVIVPGLILWFTRGSVDALGPAEYGQLEFWAAAVFSAGGLTLMASTIRLFVRQGNGTLAPWDPTHKLVIEGPYRYVRNPMISGVLGVLTAEALFFHSWPVAGWIGFFFALNTVYFMLHEEKGLEARFGDAYRQYKQNVPRWVPRSTPWGTP